MAIKYNISIPITIFREGNSFIAYSPVLDLSTSADTFERAQKRFAEVVDIFIEEIVNNGTIDEVLQGLGWSKKNNCWNPPVSVSTEVKTVSIPCN